MPSKYAIGAPKGEGSRPAKRRRVDMPSPDGFISSTPTKPVHKPPIPRFYSAFDVTDVVADKVKIDAQKAQLKHASVSKLPGIGYEQPDNLFNNNTGNQRVERPLEKRKLGFIMDLSTKVSINPKIKPKSIFHLRPAPPPPDVSTSSATNAGFKQIIPPAFPFFKPSSKPILVLRRPATPVPRPNVTIKKELRTLSTTGLGVLNDLSSDNVAEGLASILLRDQHPELSVNQIDASSAASRGLEVSPEKKGKNKNVKFVRGGLAARASSHFNRSSTAHALWKKDLEHTPNTLPSSEFCASIIKILQKPMHTSRPPIYLPGIALCRIRQQSRMQHSAYKPDHLYRVIFATLNSDSDFQTHFAEGQTILVFKPCQELSTVLDGQVAETPDLLRRPLRLPLPAPTPDSTPDPLNAPIHDITLVCTRFHIQQ